MDIQRQNFPSRLLDILVAVSESHFVSFDLELSGVPVRQYGARDTGKPSLQDRYAETKAAAEKYQILQIGLTCVREDGIDGTYELKAFNINLSPILSERLDVDRDFSFHSGAVEFLNSVGFNFQAPLAIGVPYLSRHEADLARQRAEERQSRSNDFYRPLEIKPEETETLALLKRVKEEVDGWLLTGLPDPEVLFLGPREISHGTNDSDELSRYEKRLIHQIIRQYYPNLVTAPKRGIIQVLHLDQLREDAIKRQRMRDTEERIQRQTGFRWAIEAIAGRSLSGINPVNFARHPDTGELRELSFDMKADFQRSQHLLYKKPRPVVGHNMFLDLIYLYQTFIGKLPDKVEEFAIKVHDLFPLVIDTKYLATHECGDINPMSSLQQLAEQLDGQERPLISMHKDYSKYEDYIAHHEAGYDSLLTAKVAIRLSAKLEAQKRRQEANATAPNGHTSSDDDQAGGGVSLTGDEKQRSILSVATEAVRNTVVVPMEKAVNSVKPKSVKKKGKEESKNRLENQQQSSRFAHATPFDGLQEDDGEVADADEMLNFDDLPTGAPPQVKSEAHGWDEMHESGSTQVQVAPEQEWKPLRLMPRWTAGFWHEYGNRLRVFGTQEGMFSLTPSSPVAAVQNA